MKITQEEASQIFGEVWQLMKETGFEPLKTDEQWEKLINVKCKHTGNMKKLYISLHTGLVGYYEKIKEDKA